MTLKTKLKNLNLTNEFIVVDLWTEEIDIYSSFTDFAKDRAYREDIIDIDNVNKTLIDYIDWKRLGEDLLTENGLQEYYIDLQKDKLEPKWLDTHEILKELNELDFKEWDIYKVNYN